MYYVKAMNCLPSALPEVVKLETPLPGPVEDFLHGTKRTSRGTERQRLTRGDWTDERVRV